MIVSDENIAVVEKPLFSLDYYSLKQAANELNFRLHRRDIDEDFLIKLAVSGRLELVLSAFNKIVMAYIYDRQSISDDVRAELNQILEQKSNNIFLIVTQKEITKFATLKALSLDKFPWFYIYDNQSIYRNKYKSPQEILPFISSKNTVFNDHLYLGLSDLDAGIKDLSQLYHGQKIAFDITVQDLFVLAPELQKILASISQPQIKPNSAKQQNVAEAIKSTKAERFKVAVLAAIQSLGLDPLALPASKTGTDGVRKKVRDILVGDLTTKDLVTNKNTFNTYWGTLLSNKMLKISEASSKK